MPSLSSFLPTVKPSESRSTKNAVIPLYPASASTVANTMNSPASAPLVIHILRPSSTQPSSSLRALHWSAKASEPLPTSESA